MVCQGMHKSREAVHTQNLEKLTATSSLLSWGDGREERGGQALYHPLSIFKYPHIQ